MRKELREKFPNIFIILGNDDGRAVEAAILDAAADGLWEYIHNRKVVFRDYSVFGYSFIPPTPFLLKDWEKLIERNMHKIILYPESLGILEELNKNFKLIVITQNPKAFFEVKLKDFKHYFDKIYSSTYHYKSLKKNKQV